MVFSVDVTVMAIAVTVIVAFTATGADVPESKELHGERETVAKKKQPIPERAGPRRDYDRSAWQTLVRWLACGAFAFLYFGLTNRMVLAHVVQGKPFSFSELPLIILVLLMSIPLIPQLLLEVQSVRLDDDGIRLRNLLFGFKEKWTDLVWLKNPKYLKCAVLRGKKFVYFLNRRDIPDFERLLETIEEKAVNMTS